MSGYNETGCFKSGLSMFYTDLCYITLCKSKTLCSNHFGVLRSGIGL